MKKFSYTIDGNKYEVVVNSVEGSNADIEVNGKAIKVAIEQEETHIEHHMPKKTVAAPSAAAPMAAAPKSTASKSAVLSPLPGTITKIMVTAGQSVAKGDILLTMEAMKMENSIQAERDCVVKTILVQQGQNVMQGEALVDIE